MIKTIENFEGKNIGFIWNFMLPKAKKFAISPKNNQGIDKNC